SGPDVHGRDALLPQFGPDAIGSVSSRSEASLGIRRREPSIVDKTGISQMFDDVFDDAVRVLGPAQSPANLLGRSFAKGDESKRYGTRPKVRVTFQNRDLLRYGEVRTAHQLKFEQDIPVNTEGELPIQENGDPVGGLLLCTDARDSPVAQIGTRAAGFRHRSDWETVRRSESTDTAVNIPTAPSRLVIGSRRSG